MKSVFKSNIEVLARIKIFTLRDLRLFLLGIIFISMISGTIGAFMLGLSEEEFFIGEADNILIVTEPGITTPFTGKVPESLQNDIKRIKGVVAISPETLGLSVAQNLGEKSIIVRGITSNFSSLTSIEVIEGSWFDPRFGQSDSTQINGAMVGHLLATDLDLSTGDHLQLVSTLTDMVIEVEVTGIFRSNSPCDEELLVSLSLGRAMTGKGSLFVSFLRVLIDKEIITKEILSDLLNSEYTVPILLNCQDPNLANNLVGTPIVAYTPYAAHVKTQLIEEGNKTEFQLPFGTYEFIATPDYTAHSSVLTIFVNQSFDEFFEITIGKSPIDLIVNVTYNRHPAANASVVLREKFHSEIKHSSQTNIDGLVQFHNIVENCYQIFVYYLKMERMDTIYLERSTQRNIELESSVSLTVMNATAGQEIQGGIVRVFNHNSSVEVNHTEDYQSGTPIYLDPGEYDVKFQYNEVIRDFSIEVSERTYQTIYVGIAFLSIWVRGENEKGLDSVNVSITSLNENIAQDLTNSNGTCEFQLEVGFRYNITAILTGNPSKAQQFTISFNDSYLLIIDFLDTYRLDIVALNGTMDNSSNNVLIGCDIMILQDSNPIDSLVTNVSGQVSFSLTKAGIYQIMAKKNGFNLNKSLEIRFKNTACIIKLGGVRLLITTQTINGYSISGAEITLVDENEVVSHGISNSTGQLELFFPVGDYSLQIIKGEFCSQEDISVLESQRVSLVIIIQLYGDLTIILTNKFSQNIPNAYIVVINDDDGIEYIGFTDQNGKIKFYHLLWGFYSLQITYSGEVFPKSIIEFPGEGGSQSIQIEIDYFVIDANNYQYWQSSSFSVELSSDFVSGFLKTTLTIFITTIISLIIIVSVLSLLSIASVISHPIVSNEKTLRTFEQLGATRSQVIFAAVAHLSLIGFLASGLGALFGMWVMTFFPTLRNVNVGGVIIQPKVDFLLLLVIVISNVIVISIKAAQKVDQLYGLRNGSRFQSFRQKFYNNL